MTADLSRTILVLKITGAFSGLSYIANEPVTIDSIPAHPILKFGENFRIEMRDYYPAISGSITIDNTPGSMGFERRFSDLIDSKSTTVGDIGSTATLYYYQTSPIATASISSGSLTRYLDLTVSRIVFDEETARIDFGKSLFIQKPCTRTIGATSWPSAPVGSYGVKLPLIFGADVWVPGVRATADGSSTPTYAFATVRNGYPIQLAGARYSFYDSSASRWVICTGGALYNIPLFVNQSNTGSGNTDLVENLGCFKLASNSAYVGVGADNAIITSADIYCNFNVASPAGELVVGIYRGTTTIRKITQGRAKFTDQFSSTGDHTMQVFFDAPAIIDYANDSYYLSIGGVGITLTEVRIKQTTGATTYNDFKLFMGLGNPFANLAEKPFLFDVYGPQFSEKLAYNSWSGGTLDSDGNGIAVVETTQVGGARPLATGQTATDLSSLQLCIMTNGLEDTAGACTPAAGTLITEARHVFKFFGTSLGQDLDVDGYASTIDSYQTNDHVRINGAIYGSAFVSDAIEEVCKNSGARLQLVPGTTRQKVKPIFLHPTAPKSAAVAVITDENARLVSCELAGHETVVNSMSITYPFCGYSTSYTETQPSRSKQSYTWDPTLGYGRASPLSAESYNKYGLRATRETDFSLCGDIDGLDQSNSPNIERIAAIYATRFGWPNLFAKFKVPFWMFNTVKILDIVEVLHTSMPSYFGTSPIAMQPTYSGSETDPGRGRPLKRCKRYRAQVEGIEIAETSAPMILMSVRIITNPLDPT